MNKKAYIAPKQRVLNFSPEDSLADMGGFPASKGTDDYLIRGERDWNDNSDNATSGRKNDVWETW